jgi:hypothetical protein
MRPLVKFAVTAAVVAAIPFTAAALYLALVFDANRYKPELAAAAAQDFLEERTATIRSNIHEASGAA